MPNLPDSPEPRTRRRSDRLFIWLFGAALLLLVGYRLVVHETQPAAPPTPPPPPPAATALATTPPDNVPPVPPVQEATRQDAEADQDETDDHVIATKTVDGSQSPDLSGLDDGSFQPVTAEAVEDKVYTYVEQMPQPPGGLEGLMRYLNVHVKYPAQALREQVEGKVFVNFVVRPDGRLTDVKVIKGIGAGCDEEAVRVLRQMPAWAPGKQNGRVVSVSYTVPVPFTIK